MDRSKYWLYIVVGNYGGKRVCDVWQYSKRVNHTKADALEKVRKRLVGRLLTDVEVFDVNETAAVLKIEDCVEEWKKENLKK